MRSQVWQRSRKLQRRQACRSDRVLHNRGRVSEETRQKVLAAMEEMHFTPNEAAQGLAVRKKKLHFLFVVPYPARHPFFLDVIKGAEKKADELESYGVKTTIWEMPLDDNYEKVKSRFLRLLSHCDGMATLGTPYMAEDTTPKRFIAECRERGIPVVLYNQNLAGNPQLCYVGPDLKKAGRLACGLAALMGGKEARVWVFSEGLGGGATQRLDAFREEMRQRYPKMKIIGLSEITLDDAHDEAEVERAFSGEEKPEVIYVDNPADYSICEKIARCDPEHRIALITNDLIDKERAMFEDGTISATICQEPEQQGSAPLDILFRYLAYGEVPPAHYECELSISILQSL